MNFINKLIVSSLPFLPKTFIKIFSNKYVAGIYTKEALIKIKEIIDNGLNATIDILGEHTKTEEKSLAITNKYIQFTNVSDL